MDERLTTLSFPSPLGWICMAASSKGLCLLHFCGAEQPSEERVREILAREYPGCRRLSPAAAGESSGARLPFQRHSAAPSSPGHGQRDAFPQGCLGGALPHSPRRNPQLPRNCPIPGETRGPPCRGTGLWEQPHRSVHSLPQGPRFRWQTGGVFGRARHQTRFTGTGRPKPPKAMKRRLQP
jgi:hypothetical protein